MANKADLFKNIGDTHLSTRLKIYMFV